jgi:hypothetical protein
LSYNSRKRTTIQHATFRHLLLPTGQTSSPRHSIQRKRCIGHADVHKAALAGLLAFDYSRQNAHNCVMRAPGYVGYLNTQGRRPAVLSAAVAGDAGKGQVINVMPCPVSIWPGLAVAGDGAVNKGRVLCLQNVITNSQPIHHPGPELLDNGVLGIIRPKKT